VENSGGQTQSTLDEWSCCNSQVRSKKSAEELKARSVQKHHYLQKKYTDALKAYHDHGIPPKDGAEQAMDFFDGLDNGRYTDFKVQYLNGLQIKTITAPADLNIMFNLANN
jgi:hypothetical protein